jgi:hypothetical protein
MLGCKAKVRRTFGLDRNELRPRADIADRPAVATAALAPTSPGERSAPRQSIWSVRLPQTKIRLGGFCASISLTRRRGAYSLPTRPLEQLILSKMAREPWRIGPCHLGLAGLAYCRTALGRVSSQVDGLPGESLKARDGAGMRPCLATSSEIGPRNA